MPLALTNAQLKRVHPQAASLIGPPRRDDFLLRHLAAQLGDVHEVSWTPS